MFKIVELGKGCLKGILFIIDPHVILVMVTFFSSSKKHNPEIAKLTR